jgi:uncharacterized membrane protein
MGTVQESRLAVHADFLMIIMAPLYLLWSNPKMLVLIQTIVVCLGALPIYWIASDLRKSKKIGLLFAVGYLMYPPLQRMMLHDFHAVALSTTFLLFAYWYMIKKRYGWFVLFSILAGLGKEQIWLTIGLMGLYISFRDKKPMVGLPVAALSFFTFYYLFWHAIPSVAPAKQHFALVYLSDFGDGQNAIIKNFLAKPWSVIRDAVLPDRLFYYFQLFSPLAFLSLFFPWPIIFGAHSLLINILSSNTLMRQIDYQYTSDITPFIFVAAIEGYGIVSALIERRMKGRNRGTLLRTMPYFVITGVVMAASIWGELPIGIQSRFLYFTAPQPEKENMMRVEAMIPSVYTVSATNNIGSHFSQREKLYNFPLNALSADYSIAMLGDQYAWPSGDAQKEAVDKLLASPDYDLILQQGSFYAFKKKGL